MKENILELIQGEVDGVNSPAQKDSLLQYCKEDPAIQQEWDKAVEVVQVLNSISHRNPSASFHSRVMESLPTNPSWMPKAAPRWDWANLFRLPARPSLTLAYGLVAGAFVMFAIMSAVTATPIMGDVEGVSGTMAPISTNLFSEEISSPDGGVLSVEALQTGEDINVFFSGKWSADAKISILIETPEKTIFEKSFFAIEK